MTFSEYNIQDSLYYFALHKQHSHMMPNIYLYDWESDFISITKSNYVTEYEIKITHSDYIKDFDKIDKHNSIVSGNKVIKPTLWSGNFTKPCKRPNYFYYTCPINLISLDELPEWAGLIYVNDYNNCNVIKPAPCLHKDKYVCESNKPHTAAWYKYWNLRLSKNW